jgi:hypothetical protein
MLFNLFILYIFNDTVSTIEVSIEGGRKMLMNVEYLRIWKETIVVYLKVLYEPTKTN